MANLYNSPFAQRTLKWSTLRTFDGDSSRMLDTIRPYPPHERWDEWLTALRTLPVLAVLRRAIREADPAGGIFQAECERLKRLGLAEDEVSAQAKLVALRYSRNLEKLLQLLHRQFAAEAVSLYTLHRFLTLKRATDREEDQAPLSEEEQRAQLICKTVHKAKGQEFHTVLLPILWHPFTMNVTELLLEEREKNGWEAGWMIKDGKNRHQNSLYPGARNTENLESRMEETRLLYVALTRAQHRLLLVRGPWKRDCWNELLSMAP